MGRGFRPLHQRSPAEVSHGSPRLPFAVKVVRSRRLPTILMVPFARAAPLIHGSWADRPRISLKKCGGRTHRDLDHAERRASERTAPPPGGGAATRAFAAVRRRADDFPVPIPPPVWRVLLRALLPVHATPGRRRPIRQETAQCPTKCSSTPPTRRRPGWSCCVAAVSRNSTSSLLTAASCAAISISPKSRGSNPRCRRRSSTTAATATDSWPFRKSTRTITRSRWPTGRS